MANAPIVAMLINKNSENNYKEQMAPIEEKSVEEFAHEMEHAH